MSIPKNITKEHIDKAISEIIVSEIPKERLSKTYFLKCDEKDLPPKFVLSIANKYANDHELDSDTFNAEEAVAFLKKKKYSIVDISQKQSVKIYKITSSSNSNASKLFSKDIKYFYWNNKEFNSLQLNDYVFFINKDNNYAIFSLLEKTIYILRLMKRVLLLMIWERIILLKMLKNKSGIVFVDLK